MTTATLRYEGERFALLQMRPEQLKAFHGPPARLLRERREFRHPRSLAKITIGRLILDIIGHVILELTRGREGEEKRDRRPLPMTCLSQRATLLDRPLQRIL